jgi:nitrite transporter NirC
MENNLSKSIFAGIAIALGCVLYLLAPNPTIGAVLFSCGLLCVRIYKLNLFTGKTQFMAAVNYYPLSYYITVLIGNLLGVAIIGGITYTLTHDAAVPIAVAKAAQSPALALVKGIGCGMLMSLATYEKSPLWMCLLCVPAFILTGLNHCIADAYYALVGEKIGLSFLTTIFGNIIGGSLLMSGLWHKESNI